MKHASSFCKSLVLITLSAACLGEPLASAQSARPATAKAPAASQDWPCFRGPTGMGLSNAKGLPEKWDQSSDNIAWKVTLPGPGASSPVVFGDRIYVTCYSGFFVPGEEGNKKDLKRHLISLKRDSGVIIWDKAVPAKQPEEDSIRDHGFAASTPAVDADRVYTFQGKTGVIAFDHDGNQLWQKDVGAATHGWGSAASPVLWKNLVFINASVESDSLVALDRKTGDEKWRAKGIKEAWNTPLVVTAESGREELIVATAGKVMAFSPADGKPLWTCKTDIGWYMVPSVVADKGIVYCLGGRSGVAGLAVKAGGQGDVTNSHRLWTSQKGSNVSSPVYLDGYLYWMHDSRGLAMCAKADTGELVYEKALNRAEACYSSALLANGKVYYLTRNGRTFVLAAKPEFEQISMNDLGGREQGADRSIFNSSPVPDGNRLLIRSDKFLYCIGK